MLLLQGRLEHWFQTHAVCNSYFNTGGSTNFLHVQLTSQAVNDSMLPSVCYTVFIPTLTQPNPHPKPTGCYLDVLSLMEILFPPPLKVKQKQVKCIVLHTGN